MFYYQFNIGDYKSHASHLTLMEDLAYRRLLDLYYLSEKPLPNSIESVARKIGMSDYIGDVEMVLLEFFECIDPEDREDSGWINKRADKEISVYKGFSDAGKRGAANRWSKGGDSPPIAPPIATKNQEPRTNKQKTNSKNISASALLASLGVCDSVACDWIAVRKSKNAAITKTALEGIAREAAKAGMSVEGALKVCCERGWSGFKASWVLDKAPAQTKSAQLDTADQIFRRGKYGNDGQIADFDSIRSVESSGARIPETLDGVWKSNAIEVERIEDGGCLSGLGGSDAGFDA